MSLTGNEWQKHLTVMAPEACVSLAEATSGDYISRAQKGPGGLLMSVPSTSRDTQKLIS